MWARVVVGLFYVVVMGLMMASMWMPHHRFTYYTADASTELLEVEIETSGFTVKGDGHTTIHMWAWAPVPSVALVKACGNGTYTTMCVQTVFSHLYFPLGAITVVLFGFTLILAAMAFFPMRRWLSYLFVIGASVFSVTYVILLAVNYVGVLSLNTMMMWDDGITKSTTLYGYLVGMIVSVVLFVAMACHIVLIKTTHH